MSLITHFSVGFLVWHVFQYYLLKVVKLNKILRDSLLTCLEQKKKWSSDLRWSKPIFDKLFWSKSEDLQWGAELSTLFLRHFLILLGGWTVLVIIIVHHVCSFTHAICRLWLTYSEMFVGKFHIFHHDDGKILIFCNSRILFTKSFEIIHKVRFRRPTVL